MRNLIALFILFVSAHNSYAQYNETRSISQHNEISVATGIQVEYIKSNKNNVTIECENKLHLKLVVTEVSNGKLTIKYKSNSNIRARKPTRVTVYSNYSLEKAQVSSSGHLTLKDPINATSFELDASSAGKIVTNIIKANTIDIDASSSGSIEGTINAKNVELEAANSAKITLAGVASNIDIDMRSSAKIDLSKTKIDALALDGSSSAQLTINTAISLDSNLSSSAKIYYTKIPNNIIENKTSSGGRMVQK
ncbi:GIN domain-containing protein [Sphingobacterium rhinopitheci]|uniref:GIN domain-containing protein n=1 Tax=Sphingobacterium rhinopitheci TaxID=2781960 RepID=UPI001F517E58|nr:DUF2807 domain-containing protein [Sphingobacterium rhinopitheci]MCI0922254.1 DUF2807 domain-containing protein [Sphingobacterium rhinopitheci]